MVSFPDWLPLDQGINCTVKMQEAWDEEKERCLENGPPDQGGWPCLGFLRPEFVLSEALCLDCPLAEAGATIPILPSGLGIHFPQKIMLGMLLLHINSPVP